MAAMVKRIPEFEFSQTGRLRMSLRGRSSLYVLGAFLAALLGFGIAPAESRSPTVGEVRDECSTRVNALEAEVRSLREQLRVVSAQPRTLTSVMTAGSGVERRGAASRALTSSCNPPYDFDEFGIKYYRPECLVEDTMQSCTIPYGFTPAGIKYYKATCLDAHPTLERCDPPYQFEANGVKRFKPECLRASR